MRIIPAVDIQNGQCMRLLQGRKEDVTVYGKDPAAMAKLWEDLGAERLHLVDLDGAFDGSTKNLVLIGEIVKSLKIPVQLGGGIRTLDDIEKFISSGINRVVLGTKAYEDRNFLKEAVKRFGGRVIVGIDAKDGFVAIEGWTKVTDTRAVDFARELESIGVSRIIFTDIARDGTLLGPNTKSLRIMTETVAVAVIASGGIGCLEDVRKLRVSLGSRLDGVIIGKALYTGAVKFEEARDIARD